MKVTDGDLIVINLDGDNISTLHIERLREKVKKWVDARGLNNVEILISGGDVKMSIAKFTVNDVFEDEVLKEKK